MKNVLYSTYGTGLLAAGLSLGLLTAAPPPAAAATDGQSAVNEQSADYYREALGYLKRGNIEAAIIQLKNAIRSDGGNAEARFRLAELYLRTNRGQSAEKELKAAAQAGYDADLIALPLARAYLLQNKYGTLLEEITPPANPETEAERLLAADLLSIRAEAEVRSRRLNKAVENLSAALELVPDHVGAHVAMSLVNQRQGEVEKAMAFADRALALAPEDQDALLRKADLLRLTGELEPAAGIFDKILDRWPEDGRARLGRATARVGLGRDADAQQDVDHILTTNPSHPFATYLNALLKARAGDYREALAVLQTVRKALGDYGPALYLNGALNYANDQLQQAQRLIERYVKQVPGDRRGHKLLGAILLRLNRPAQAIEALERVQPVGNDLQLLTLLGGAYMGVRDYDKASAVYEQAAEVAPEDSDLQTRLAASRISTGQDGSAVALLEKIIETDQDAGRATTLLIVTHLRNRDFDAALAATDKLAERLPDSPLADNFRGTIYRAKGDEAAARAAFEAALGRDRSYSPAALNLAALERASGNPAAARQRYESILGRDPTNQRALQRLAEMDFAAGRSEDAIDRLNRAISAAPDAAMPRLMLVNGLLRQRQPEQALSQARDMVQVLPQHPDALDALARTQMALNRPVNAVATYQQLVELMPDSAIVHHRLAGALLALKRHRDAAAALDKALALDPTLVRAQQDRVNLDYIENGLEAALARAREMLAANPEQAFAHQLVGDMLYRAKRYQDALAAYDDGFRLEASGDLVRRLHQTHARAGAPERGREIARRWLAEHPDDTEVRFALANELIQAGAHGSAITETEALLTRLPDNVILLNNLAWLYDQVGDARALETANRAHRLAPEAPEVTDTLGWMLVARGELARGVELLRRANEGAPDNPEIDYHLAAALHKSGAVDQARERLQRLLDKPGHFNGRQAAEALLLELARQ